MSETTATIIGEYINPGSVLASQVITNNQRSGGATKNTFSGPPVPITQLYTSYNQQGWDCELQTGGGIWTLITILNRDIITNPNSDPIPPDQWEIEAEVSEQSLLECTDLPTIALLTTNGKEAIESQLRNPLNKATTNYTGSAAQMNAVTTVYNLMRCGVQSRPIFFPTLKRTITVSALYQCNWSMVNVGNILKTSTLISTYNLTPDVATLLPASPGQSTDVNGVTTYGGWLEFYPTVSKVGINKKQISQKWQYNTRWSVVEFPNYL